MRALTERFWSNVPDQPGDDCWEWTGSRGRQGYGQFRLNRNEAGHYPLVQAHRVAFALCRGELHQFLVCHACDNPGCVNPNHLFLGTHTDNMRDKESKGLGFNPSNLKTHCPQGHPYSDDNTYRDKTGRRACRACRQVQSRKWNEKLRQIRTR